MSLRQMLRHFYSDIADHPDLKLFQDDGGEREEGILWWHRNAPWDRFKLTHNINFHLRWLSEIQMDLYLGYEEYYPTDWDWDVISAHPDITEKWLSGFYEDKLNFTILSRHPNFTYKWMNLYIGANWDFDHIIERSDFTQKDLLNVFLRPTQKWNTELLVKKFGKDWVFVYNKVLKKIHESYVKYDNFLENEDVDQYHCSVQKWLDKSFKRIINYRNEGWNDDDDDDLFCLCGYFKNHKEFALNEFDKAWKHYQISKELLPIAWHPCRYYDWCHSEDEKDDLAVLFNEPRKIVKPQNQSVLLPLLNELKNKKVITRKELLKPFINKTFWWRNFKQHFKWKNSKTKLAEIDLVVKY